MSNALFNDFQAVSSKAWKQQIQADLKGADYNETLVWQSPEGIDVKPFYHADEFDALATPSAEKATSWNILETFYVANASTANKKALEALTKGAEALNFNIPNKDTAIQTLLEGIAESIPIYISLEFLDADYVKSILEHAPNKAHTYIYCDIIGHLAKSGNWFSTLNDDHETCNRIVKETNTLSIDLSLYQNAGATITQQLAYGLAHLNEYFNHFNEKLTAQEKEQLRVVFNVAVGTNYFFEIAKLRALRNLHFSLASEYGFNNTCHIVATPTKRNKTIYDYNTNMLRTTTECMSAILGGANAICNSPYDTIFHKTNEFGDRISRNQLLVLKHESYFDKVNNPASGTYYIESLTDQLSEKALTLFKDIEATGGFLSQLKEGTIQRKLKESAQNEQDQFNTGEKILLGTNKHPNPEDNMKNNLELYPFVKTNPRKTLIEPIIEKRLAEASEQERLKNE
ncbi:methylmalonyl-CoA mutase [Mangrovimonas yunxiaonensis]|uniref:Methylmalonyl-CoA mutase n=1 Tax=Mangrovimonas yunxiaonensis TaxID=1197477 RepID=A0A084TNK2_9FLAO|nr:methylmalonyl-CoA mutase subunit beta [Mangrovimonas yunxiaonensis]KFB02288.1 methylmalonyl-CoA mutase [Mangrovimonas yunxiaonensis]